MNMVLIAVFHSSPQGHTLIISRSKKHSKYNTPSKPEFSYHDYEKTQITIHSVFICRCIPHVGVPYMVYHGNEAQGHGRGFGDSI